MTNLIWLGVFFFGLMVLFSLLTVPVELDASRRGLALLTEAGLPPTDEDRNWSRVLTAAALTYLAAPSRPFAVALLSASLAVRAIDPCRCQDARRYRLAAQEPLSPSHIFKGEER